MEQKKGSEVCMYYHEFRYSSTLSTIRDELRTYMSENTTEFTIKYFILVHYILIYLNILYNYNTIIQL